LSRASQLDQIFGSCWTERTEPAGPWFQLAPRTIRLLMAAALLLSMILSVACGYQVHSSVGSLPSGINSLGIPTFVNKTPQYKVEQRLTSAILKEFTTRTRVPVSSNSSGVDAVLRGEIHSVNSSPVTFSTDPTGTFASSFLVTVQISVKLMRVSDAKVLWENADFLFRERYVLNGKVTDFFSEEGPALDRLAQDFAASLASTLLNR
jgi:hypothetical protein